jgi:hypothetical protein
MNRKLIFPGVLLILGMLLLLINVAGLFKSLRNEALYEEQTPYKDDISIRFEEAREQWDRQAGETDQLFAARVTMLVNHSMAHYWRDEGIRKYHMRVPLWENYLITLRQWIEGDKKYEFRSYKKVIERGVGICSQPCIGLKYLLNANGIEADLWDLQQHIVVGARFEDGTEYTLDPDYGYVIPYSVEQLHASPALVEEAYREHDQKYAAHIQEHKHTADIVQMYSQDGNRIYYMKKPFEDFLYVAKWLLPLIFILPFIRIILKRRKHA